MIRNIGTKNSKLCYGFEIKGLMKINTAHTYYSEAVIVRKNLFWANEEICRVRKRHGGVHHAM